MHTWVCGIFGVNFEAKKALRSSRLVLAFRSHGLTGCKLGAVQIRFPVWRELKPTSDNLPVFIAEFRYAFPFEGNWNSSLSLLGAVGYNADVQIRFPVWRELKHTRFSLNEHTHTNTFRYAFPFEGNWNIFNLANGDLWSEFRYAFPFEGNWN